MAKVLLALLAVVSESSLTVDASTILPAVTLTPTLIWQKNEAGEDVLSTSTTESQSDSTSTTSTVTIPAATAIALQTVSLAYTIPLGLVNDNDAAIGGLCWYPVSGYYGILSRVLFYAIMFFAVFARRHQWLIVGALAAGMTYAGTAAIHACIIVWSNSGLGNNDMWAILGILVFACAMIVPLFTWSKTMKDIGKSHEEDSIGRSIMIAWSFLIFMGFISIFVGVIVGRVSQSVGRGSYHVISPAWSRSENFTCTPANGVLDLTAGQSHNWSVMYATKEFVDYNHCTNPCGKLEYGTILKSVEDLTPLTRREVNFWAETESDIKRENKIITIAFALLFGGLAMCWSILQTLTIIFFGRRSPIQVRNRTYLLLFSLLKRKDPKEMEPTIKNHYMPHLLAKTVAYGFYTWGVATTLISSIIVVGSIVAIELMMNAMPQADNPYEIDQWAPWVATGLILITAFLYRYEGIFEDCLMRVVNVCLGWIHCCLHRRRKVSRNTQPSEKEALMQQRPAVSSGSSNRSILWQVFADSAQHYRERFGSMPKLASGSWQDSKDFWSDSLKTASKDHGQGHGRRRKVVNFEGQKFPDDWKADGLDDWLTLEEFIKACQEYDQRRRTNPKSKGGRGYKWQPRVIPDDGIVDALRTELDRELLKDIFRRGHGKTLDHEAALDDSAVSSISSPTGVKAGKDTIHGIATLVTINPAHQSNDTLTQSGNTQLATSTDPRRSGNVQISDVHHNEIRPVSRSHTVGLLSQQSATAAAAAGVTHGEPIRSPQASPEIPSPIRHAETFPTRHQR